MSKQTFTAVYTQSEGWWVGFVEEVPGAMSQGATLEECQANLREALILMLDVQREDLEAVAQLKEVRVDGYLTIHVVRVTLPSHDFCRHTGELMTPSSLLERITVDPAICHGQPTIRGLRYPVALLLDLLSGGMTIDELLADYEDLEREDILAALAFAARLSQVKRIDLIPA